jgi:hypothetical protein
MKQIIIEQLEMNNQTTLFADGFDEAIIGLEYNTNRVIYSVEKCIEILREDMSWEDAMEHFDFNIAGAYVGEQTPIFIHKIERNTK